MIQNSIFQDTEGELMGISLNKSGICRVPGMAKQSCFQWESSILNPCAETFAENGGKTFLWPDGIPGPGS